MKVKKVKIGDFETENNVFFAPLAGFSDFAMREICKEYGAGLTFTEMVSAKGLVFGDENTKALLRTSPLEKIKCVQIFGNDPEIMRRAIESKPLEKFDIVDINFGCPMPKIFNNCEGSALLRYPNLAERIVEECSKSGKTITCKMRIGIKDGEFVSEDFAKALEQGGAKMITVHGRVRDKIYSGEVNFDEIRKIKKSVSVPVIANGGVFTVSDADELSEKTETDGIMLARGALESPWLFSEILNLPLCKNKKELVNRHIDLLLTEYDDRYASIVFRKQLCLYLKGEKNSAAFKQTALKITSAKELKKICYDFFAESEKTETN